MLANKHFRNKHIRNLGLGLLIVFSLWQWSQALFIYAKAYLAKVLIHNAWSTTLVTQIPTKPWRWADTWPVAKLQLPEGDHFYILAGSAGNSLAFGPGHNSVTALPGTNGTSIIGGHRDTHFRQLKHIQAGDIIEVQNQKGEWKKYRVEHYWVANSEKQPLQIQPQRNQLILITCYPFNTLNPHGPERFVVQAAATY